MAAEFVRATQELKRRLMIEGLKGHLKFVPPNLRDVEDKLAGYKSLVNSPRLLAVWCWIRERILR